MLTVCRMYMLHVANDSNPQKLLLKLLNFVLEPYNEEYFLYRK